ncbi:MAG TPA: Ku protein [Bryobacteraceae bacterium]|nr:Ku protein [Bryobacteraceae bacterium]
MAAIVWKGYISFGLVSFPVRLFSAARAETIHFHMLHRKDLSRLKEVWYCAKENKPVERSEIVKGFELEKNDYVVVEDKDVKAIAPPTATTMDVLQFVASDDVDPIYFERSYYVTPDEKVDKPYALFLEALRESKQSAIAQLTMHGRENAVLIRAVKEGLILHTLFYPDELHKANRKAGSPNGKLNRKELDLAKSLIEKLSAPFQPEQLHDTYRENLEKLIEKKKKGQKITPIRQPKRAPVTDLMEALKQSLKSSASGKTKRRKAA